MDNIYLKKAKEAIDATSKIEYLLNNMVYEEVCPLITPFSSEELFLQNDFSDYYMIVEKNILHEKGILQMIDVKDDMEHWISIAPIFWNKEKFLVFCIDWNLKYRFIHSRHLITYHMMDQMNLTTEELIRLHLRTND